VRPTGTLTLAESVFFFFVLIGDDPSNSGHESFLKDEAAGPLAYCGRSSSLLRETRPELTSCGLRPAPAAGTSGRTTSSGTESPLRRSELQRGGVWVNLHHSCTASEVDEWQHLSVIVPEAQASPDDRRFSHRFPRKKIKPGGRCGLCKDWTQRDLLLNVKWRTINKLLPPRSFDGELRGYAKKLPLLAGQDYNGPGEALDSDAPVTGRTVDRTGSRNRRNGLPGGADGSTDGCCRASDAVAAFTSAIGRRAVAAVDIVWYGGPFFPHGA